MKIRYYLLALLAGSLGYAIGNMDNTETIKQQGEIKPTNSYKNKKDKCNYPVGLNLKHTQLVDEYQDGEWYYQQGYNASCKVIVKKA